jgi:hypothetical protein
MPDYTKQLDEIVRLLSQPSLSPWLLSAFSVLLGVIGGEICRAIEPLIKDGWRRHSMRQVLYDGIAHNFFQVDTITMFGEAWADNGVRNEAFRQLTNSFDFDAEDHIKRNLDVFAQIAERREAKDMYDLVHRIVDQGPAVMDYNCRKLQWVLGHYIHEGELPAQNFQKYLHSNKKSDRIIGRAADVYDQSARNWEQFQEQNRKYLSS